MRHGIRLGGKHPVAEIPGGVLRAEAADGRIVEMPYLRGIRERGLHHHKRPAALLGPLARPVLLLLQRRAVRLVVHRGENFSGRPARVLEELARPVERAHKLFGGLRAAAGFALRRRVVVVVGNLCGILIPRIGARVEIRIPHEYRRVVAVVLQKPLNLPGIPLHFLVLVRGHLEEVVEPRAVALAQVLGPRDLRSLPERVEAHGVVVHVLYMRDVLAHGVGVPEVLAEPAERGGSPHAHAHLFAVHAEFGTLNPGLSEPEILCWIRVGKL